MLFPRTAAKMASALLGFTLVLFALSVSNESYAQALLSGNGKDLSWGPTLFRVLLVFHGCLLIAFGFWRGNARSDKEQGAGEVEKTQFAELSAIIFMAVLSILAFALRLWNLNSDLWIDEVLTLLDFVRKPIGEIIVSFPSQNQHMLFSILAHASTTVFGESAWSLRLPAVLFGIGSIWAFFFLCKSLLGLREALLGSALMTVSYHHIWFSQNAWVHRLAVVHDFGDLVLARGSEDERPAMVGRLRRVDRVWDVGAPDHGICGCRPCASSSGPAQMAIFRRRDKPRGLAGTACRNSAVCGLAVKRHCHITALRSALHEFLAVGLHEESHDSEWTNPIWVVTETLKGLSVGFAGIAVVVFGGALVTFGWVTLFRKDRRAAMLMVLPALLAGGSMLLLGHNLWPRFFFFSMGFGLLLVIQGVTQLPAAVAGYFRSLKEPLPLASAVGLGFVGLLILVSVFTLPKNYALPKQNFSGAKSFVESRISPGDGLVAVSLAGIVYGNYLSPHWQAVGTGPELETYQNDNNRVWLVYTIPIEIKAAKPELWRMIQDDYDVVKVFPGTLNGGEVFVCQKKMN